MRSIERLRRDAKALKKAFAAGDTGARARASAILGPRDRLRHTDALHVVAREAGHASWPRLKLAVDLARMDRAARAERLSVALFYGQDWVVEALCAAEPDLGRDTFGLACALYDLDHVRGVLAADPDAARRAIGPRRPILHLAASQYHRMGGDAQAMLGVAEALLAAGADVNDGWPSEPGSPHILSALYAALGHAGNLTLAEWLLEHGADPNDDESLYHATELGHLDGVRLLIRYGVRCAGTNALPRMLDFDDLEGVRLLLGAGADPNEGIATHPSGAPSLVVPALHQAARRGRSGATARLLLDHGADGRPPYKGHSAYAYARMVGNRAVAAELERAGQATPLDPAEDLLARAADGPVTGRIAEAALTEETRRLLIHLIGFGDPSRRAHLERLVAIGIDPDWTDAMEMPAIHVAGWEGHADLVAWLLTFGPDLAHRNAYGGDVLGTVIHGAEFCPARDGRDHLGCARLVLEAGSRLHRSDIDSCGVEEMVALLEDWAEAHPECVVVRAG